jgi:hypothetical protein
MFKTGHSQNEKGPLIFRESERGQYPLSLENIKGTTGQCQTAPDAERVLPALCK